MSAITIFIVIKSEPGLYVVSRMREKEKAKLNQS